MSKPLIFGELGIYPDKATARAFERAEKAARKEREARVRDAAHDLLDALEELVGRDEAEARESGFTDDEMTWLEDARRAIAKAKGGAA
jgi:hypothetical protein